MGLCGRGHCQPSVATAGVEAAKWATLPSLHRPGLRVKSSAITRTRAVPPQVPGFSALALLAGRRIALDARSDELAQTWQGLDKARYLQSYLPCMAVGRC